MNFKNNTIGIYDLKEYEYKFLISSVPKFIYVKKGEIVVETSLMNYELKEAEGMIIFPNIAYRIKSCEYADATLLKFFEPLSDNYFKHTNMPKGKIVKLDNELLKTLALLDENSNPFKVKSVFYSLLDACCEDVTEEFSYIHNTDIQKIIDCIEANYEQKLTLDDIRKHTGINKNKISGIMKKYTGFDFVEFVSRFRLEKACRLIINSDLDVTTIGLQCGFGSIRNFNRVFKLYHNMTPSEFRKKKNDNRF